MYAIRSYYGTGLAVLGALLAAGWVMGGFLYAYIRRAIRHRREMAEQQHLAQLGTLSAVLARITSYNVCYTKLLRMDML